MNAPSRTPLFAFHESLGARFTTFSGWEMPVSYGSSLDEHLACRRTVAAFDVSHMGEIEVSGSEAGRFLDHVLTNAASTSEIGQAVYSPMCRRDGGVIDDLITCKRTEADYLLCVNASNIEADFIHLSTLAKNFSCRVRNVSESYGQFAIQGPEAIALVEEVTGMDLTAIGKMRFIEAEVFGSPILLARSGYTGEDGFEIYCHAEALAEWAEALTVVGGSLGLRWAGLAARDGLRLEAGLPLYGHELSDEITPLQAGLAWTVKWDKPDGFVGRDALLREKEEGSPGRIAYYLVGDRRIPRMGASVAYGGRQVGRVTSGGYSPLLEKPIGCAWVDQEAFAERDSDGWTADIRGSEVPLSLGKPALLRWGREGQR